MCSRGTSRSTSRSTSRGHEDCQDAAVAIGVGQIVKSLIFGVASDADDEVWSAACPQAHLFGGGGAAAGVERLQERVPAEHGALDADREFHDALKRFKVAEINGVIAVVWFGPCDAHE
jgi:hypothetical protein